MDTETDYFSNIAHSMPNIADKIIDKFKFNSKLAFRPNEIPQLTSLPAPINTEDMELNNNIPNPDSNLINNQESAQIISTDIQKSIGEDYIQPDSKKPGSTEVYDPTTPIPSITKVSLGKENLVSVDDTNEIKSQKRVSFNISDAQKMFESNALIYDLKSFGNKQFGIFVVICIAITFGIYSWEFLKKDEFKKPKVHQKKPNKN